MPGFSADFVKCLGQVEKFLRGTRGRTAASGRCSTNASQRARNSYAVARLHRAGSNRRAGRLPVHSQFEWVIRHHLTRDSPRPGHLPLASARPFAKRCGQLMKKGPTQIQLTASASAEPGKYPLYKLSPVQQPPTKPAKPRRTLQLGSCFGGDPDPLTLKESRQRKEKSRKKLTRMWR